MKNCPNCDHENLDDARFCEECGQPFTIDIAENNYQLRPAAKINRQPNG